MIPLDFFPQLYIELTSHLLPQKILCGVVAEELLNGSDHVGLYILSRVRECVNECLFKALDGESDYRKRER